MKRGIVFLSLFLGSILVISGCNPQMAPIDRTNPDLINIDPAFRGSVPGDCRVGDPNFDGIELTTHDIIRQAHCVKFGRCYQECACVYDSNQDEVVNALDAKVLTECILAWSDGNPACNGGCEGDEFECTYIGAPCSGETDPDSVDLKIHCIMNRNNNECIDLGYDVVTLNGQVNIIDVGVRDIGDDFTCGGYTCYEDGDQFTDYCLDESAVPALCGECMDDDWCEDTLPGSTCLYGVDCGYGGGTCNECSGGGTVEIHLDFVSGDGNSGTYNLNMVNTVPISAYEIYLDSGIFIDDVYGGLAESHQWTQVVSTDSDKEGHAIAGYFGEGSPTLIPVSDSSSWWWDSENILATVHYSHTDFSVCFGWQAFGPGIIADQYGWGITDVEFHGTGGAFPDAPGSGCKFWD